MQKLGKNKPMLLSQLRAQTTLETATLLKLLGQYEDLTIDDLTGIVPRTTLDSLIDTMRDPAEASAWKEIEALPRTTPDEVRTLIMRLNSYMTRFPSSPKASEASALQTSLPDQLRIAEEEERKRREREREQSSWDRLDKQSYMALLSYRSQYPSTVHMDEIDDACWSVTMLTPTPTSISRYIADWPAGIHREEASRIIGQRSEWDDVKRSGDIFRISEYHDANAASPLRDEINRVYYEIREKEKANMRENPNEYDRELLQRLFDSNVFSLFELSDEGLITDDSWETLNSEIRDYLPEVSQFQIPDPELRAETGCTDIYLFGTPGTGKTCLLMGLAGANGHGGYTLNMRVNGGPYASALQQFVNAGLTPGRTFGNYVTVINGSIYGQQGSTKYVCPINLVEMSGEEFALRISEGASVKFSDMGTGATNLLTNTNRKVFFIIVDATKDKIKFEYEETIYDSEGNPIDTRIRRRYISQLDIINKFVGLFTLPENQEIMSRVDAIHFIVTKADVLGDITEREDKAEQLIKGIYGGPVLTLKEYCSMSKRINATTDYKPMLFTFSLGQFYLGDVFRFNNSDTLKIVDAMRKIVMPVRKETWWDRFKRALN